MQVAKGIEEQFGWWGEVAWRHSTLLIVVMVLMAVGFASRIPHLEIDTSTENYLRNDDPIKIAYDALRDQFGRDNLVMLAIEPPEVFDLAFLEKLRRLHEDLENEIPHLEEVTSLVNVRSTRGVGDELIVEDLLEEMPGDEIELAALRERVLANPSYLDSVVSADGSIAVVMIETVAFSSIGVDTDALDVSEFDEDLSAPETKPPYLTGAENAEIVEATKRVIERYRGPDFSIHVAGSVLLPHELQLAMQREMPVFFLASLIVIGGLLTLLFRRISPVLLALLVVVLGVISTLGMAELLNFKLTLSTQIVPTFLLAVGIGYSVHLLSVFLQLLDSGGDRREALIQALRHSGLPILMTGTTTVMGMLSFLAAELAPINELGVVTALGVGMTLVYALILLPALLAALPLRPRSRVERPPAFYERALRASGMMAARHPWKVVLVTALLVLISAALASQLRFSSNPLAYLPPEHEFRQAMDYLDERVGGSFTIQVLIDTGRENGLHDPEVLNRIEAIHDRVQSYWDEGEKVRRTSSLIFVAKETHRALNENRPEFYTIPQDSRLIAQEFLLFENSGSDDLERLVDSQFQLTRITIRILWQDGFDMIDLVERSRVEFQEIIGDQAEVTVTGMSAVITRTVGATISSLSRSYVLALILITPLMMLLIGSLRAGLVSMVPNLVPILMTLGLMVLSDIGLDMFTLMFGCIAIGLAVDDTIHLIAGFRRYLAQTGDPIEAIDLTMQTTGRALLFTSIVLTLGFLVFLLSSMANLRDFGLLTAFAIGSAFTLDVTATPALLVLVTRGRKS